MFILSFVFFWWLIKNYALPSSKWWLAPCPCFYRKMCSNLIDLLQKGSQKEVCICSKKSFLWCSYCLGFSLFKCPTSVQTRGWGMVLMDKVWLVIGQDRFHSLQISNLHLGAIVPQLKLSMMYFMYCSVFWKFEATPTIWPFLPSWDEV